MASLQNIHIRQLTEADFENLKMFHVKHFQSYTISDNSFTMYLTQSQYQTYGMFHVKHLIGYGIFLSCGDEADIVYICTAPDHRRQGVATAIIQHYIKTHNISKIFLEVSVKNVAALNLYRALGFEIVTIRPQYQNNIDSYLMIKRI